MDFFFFFLRLTYGIWKFLGQGLNPSHSCDLCCHCDNAASLTHCTTVGAPTMGIFEKHCLRKISIIPYTTAISHFKIFFYLSMTNKAWAWDPLYSWYSVHSLAPHPFQFQSLTFYFIFLNLFIYFLLFRATLEAHGSSQARGRIGATAAGLCHSHSHNNTGSEPHLRPITAHGNARSLTLRVKPGIEPSCSWILTGFLNHWILKPYTFSDTLCPILIGLSPFCEFGLPLFMLSSKLECPLLPFVYSVKCYSNAIPFLNVSLRYLHPVNTHNFIGNLIASLFALVLFICVHIFYIFLQGGVLHFMNFYVPHNVKHGSRGSIAI